MLVEKRINLVTPIGKYKYNVLEVSADYQKEQTNYFNGNYERGGLYVYIKPIKCERGITSCTMLSASALESGFKVFCHEMNRNNRKKIMRFGDLITENVLESIRENYEKQEFYAVKKIIEKISENFK